jgi:hypothetical protein
LLIRTVPGYDHRDLDSGSKKETQGLCREFGSRIASVFQTNAPSSHDYVAWIGALTPVGTGWEVQFVGGHPQGSNSVRHGTQRA